MQVFRKIFNKNLITYNLKL